MNRGSGLGTAALVVALLAIAGFLPLWRCCQPGEDPVIVLGTHDAAALARRLRALLRGVPCDTCEGRGRVSLWRVLTK